MAKRSHEQLKTHGPTNLLPKITPPGRISRENHAKESSQIQKLPEIPRWKTFLEPLPEITEHLWENESTDDLGEIDSMDIQSDLSLEDSLRKSLTLISSLPNRRDAVEEKSTKFMLLEMNEFFVQMAEELRYLKSNLIKDKPTAQEVQLQKNYPRYYADPRLMKIVKDIEASERKLKEHSSEISLVKEERKEIHEEIRSLISESLDSKHRNRAENNVPYYLLKKETKAPKKEKKEEELKKAFKQVMKQKTPVKEDKNFVQRNIELAKDRTMYNSKCSLTDEEKVKLASLLSDIEEKAEPDTKKYLESYVKQVDNCELHSEQLDTNEIPDNTERFEENGFKLRKKDSKLLENLNEQLQNVQERDQSDHYDLHKIQQDEKPWRRQIMEKTLKDIEKNLIKISNEKCEEANRPDQSELAPETMSIEDIRREYNETLGEVKYIFDSVEDEGIEIAQLDHN